MSVPNIAYKPKSNTRNHLFSPNCTKNCSSHGSPSSRSRGWAVPFAVAAVLASSSSTRRGLGWAVPCAVAAVLAVL
eukprot:618909-Rhodomonas_salina.1